MTAAPRLKQAVRKAIHACGGIEGAAATVEKSASHVGRWNSLNDADLPTLGDALAMDEIALAHGAVPAILAKLARELGHVVIRLPDAAAGGASLPVHVMQLVEEVGDVSHRVRDALADGDVGPREAALIETELDELIEKAVQARAYVRALQAKPAAVKVVAR